MISCFSIRNPNWDPVHLGYTFPMTDTIQNTYLIDSYILLVCTCPSKCILVISIYNWFTINMHVFYTLRLILTRAVIHAQFHQILDWWLSFNVAEIVLTYIMNILLLCMTGFLSFKSMITRYITFDQHNLAGNYVFAPMWATAC